jgi:DNA-nicking Smr family endonuclease
VAKLKLDLHDIYNRGREIDTELNRIMQEAIERRVELVEIIPGKGSGQLKKWISISPNRSAVPLESQCGLTAT